MLIRSIGSAFRGKATPTQVFLAAFLAGVLGFIPGFFLKGDLGGGFAQSPGLILAVFFLVLVLNANLGIFGLCLIVSKLSAWLLVDVAFAIGRFLLDGPTRPLFQKLINAPVTAWFGLEYYATSGGLVLGAVFGGVLGFLFVRVIKALRAKMAGVEEKSEAYQKYSKKLSVRFLTWAFLGGGKGKKTSWKDLAEQKRGLPFRLWGVILVVLLAGGLYVFQGWLSTPMLTSAAQSGLTSANGATVDVKQAKLDFGAGLLQVTGLAMADKQALDTDVLRADNLTAKIDTTALLSKRMVIDELTSSNASSGLKRAVAGILAPGTPEPPPPPPEPNTKTLDDYMKDAKVWKDRLDQAREWLKTIGGDGSAKPADKTPAEISKDIEELKQQVGAAKVAAMHLIEGAPRLLIRKITIDGISIASLPGETLDLKAANLSSSPSLVAEPMTFALNSRSDKLKFIAGSTAQKGSLGLDFAYKGLPVDTLFSQLKLGGAPPVKGGTMDIAIPKGSFLSAPGASSKIDFPLNVTLQKTTFAIAGTKETAVDNLMLPIGVRGALSSPSITLDDKALSDALVKAGQQELAGFVNAQAGKLLGGKIPGVENLIDPNKSVQENVDAAKAKAEAKAKKAADAAKAKAEEEAKKAAADLLKGKAPDVKGIEKGLKGLLPGGKKDEPKK